MREPRPFSAFGGRQPARSGPAHHGSSSERGAAATVIALSLLLIMGFVAFAVDMGLARVQDRQNQTAADSAALAAVSILVEGGSRSEANSAAIRITWENLEGVTPTLAEWESRWLSCSDSDRDLSIYTETAVLPIATDCISYNVDNTQVRVRTPSIDVETSFASLIGFDTIPTSAFAEAIAANVGGGSYAVFGISETCGSDYTVILKGGTTISDGLVHSNANMRVEAPANMPKGVTHRTSIVNEAGVKASKVGAQPDPLAHVNMADYRPGGAMAKAAGSSYFDFTGSVITTANVTSPGIYYTNRWVLLKTGIAINATFIIDNPGLTKKSAFESNGTGYDLSYFADDDANPDKLLVYTNAPYSEKCKPQANPAIHLNGSEGDFKGTLYAPNAGAHLNGSSSGARVQGAVVADTVNIDGTGNTIVNDGSFLRRDPEVGLYK